ncbi:MAG: NAD(P)-binding protein [Phycisphaerales bacterium]
MKRTNCTVAGGGLSGLFSAILMADRFESVVLVEKGSECGGILRSEPDDRGVFFDCGTHVPDFTSRPEIDEILFGTREEIERDWTVFKRLHAASFYGGRWYDRSGTVDARALPEEDYCRGIVELLSRDKVSTDRNLATYLIETMGPTLTTKLYAPIVQKLYGVEADQLTTSSSVGYFGLTRLIALTPCVTNKLKELEAFDSKLDFHTAEEAGHLYPKQRGVGFWVERLTKKALSKGVKILTNEVIERISAERGVISSVRLGKRKENIPCDFLVWTAPPAQALRAAGIPTAPDPTTYRTASVFNYSFDKQITNKKSLYLWNWDPNYKGFRITLYPNLRPHVPGNDVTVEVLSGPEEARDFSLKDICRELADTGLVPPDAKVLSESKKVLHNTFPVPTPAHEQAVNDYLWQLEEAFENIMIAGRFGGKAWFHKDVIREVFDQIQAFDKSPVMVSPISGGT